MLDQIQAETGKFTPGSAWDRYFASIIDAFIIGFPINAALLMVTYFTGNLTYYFKNYGVISATIIIPLIIYMAYFVRNKGTTIGKNLFGLVVKSYNSEKNITYYQVVLREGVKFGLSYIPIIGLFLELINWGMIVFLPEKRGIHDRIAKTQVVKVKNVWSVKYLTLICVGILVIYAVLLYFYIDFTQYLD